MTDPNPNSGHAPGLPGLTRRSLLAGAPLALTPAALLAEPVALLGETPILLLYRQWQAEEDRLNDLLPTAIPEEEFDALVDAQGATERALVAEPCTSLADLAAKIAVSCASNGEFAPGPLVAAECRALLAGAL